MEASFWHKRWENGEIAFHESQVNPYLIAHFEKLNLPTGARVFLPLCGKTLDIGWLLEQGYQVAGCELSPLAIQDLFNRLQLQVEITELGEIARYSARGIDIFVGDIFSLSADQLGPVDAIYDRAALVALPAEMRRLYADHVMQLTNNAPQLVIAYQYDQSKMAGPPHSVSDEELQRLFETVYRLQCIESTNLVDGLKGKVAAVETAMLLEKIC